MIRIAARYDLAHRAVEVVVFTDQDLTRGGFYAVDVGAAPLIPPQDHPKKMLMDEDSARKLMDDLWAAGIRPTLPVDEGALAATREHLKDMQQLVWRLLEGVVPKTATLTNAIHVATMDQLPSLSPRVVAPDSGIKTNGVKVPGSDF